MTMRIRTIALPAAAALFCSAFVGCADRSLPRMPLPVSQSKKDPKRMSMGELQQFASTSAVVAVAETGTSLTQVPSTTTPPIGRIEREEKLPLKYQANLPQPPNQMVPLKPINPPEVTRPQNNINPPASKEQFANVELARNREGFKIEGIRSSYFENQVDAQRNALLVASDRICEKLRQLDHPIYLSRMMPYEAAKYVVPNSGRVVPLSKGDVDALDKSSVPSNKIQFQVDVELTDQHIQSLRSEDRIRTAAPIVFGLVLLAGVTSLFLRLTGIAASAVRRTAA